MSVICVWLIRGPPKVQVDGCGLATTRVMKISHISGEHLVRNYITSLSCIKMFGNRRAGAGRKSVCGVPAGQHPRPSLWLAWSLGDHHGEDGDDHDVDHSGFDDEVNIGVRMVMT